VLDEGRVPVAVQVDADVRQVEPVPGLLRREPREVRLRREEARQDDEQDEEEQVVQREDPQHPPHHEVLVVALAPLRPKEDPGDEEPREGEEEVDAHPSLVSDSVDDPLGSVVRGETHEPNRVV